MARPHHGVDRRLLPASTDPAEISIRIDQEARLDRGLRDGIEPAPDQSPLGQGPHRDDGAVVVARALRGMLEKEGEGAQAIAVIVATTIGVEVEVVAMGGGVGAED